MVFEGIIISTCRVYGRVFKCIDSTSYSKGSIIVMILQGVDTHYTTLQGHAIVGDVILLYT